MVGGKYQWLIMGTYGPTWWNEMRAPCPVKHLSAALDGCILTDYLPLSTTGEITVSGIVSNVLIFFLKITNGDYLMFVKQFVFIVIINYLYSLSKYYSSLILITTKSEFTVQLLELVI